MLFQVLHLPVFYFVPSGKGYILIHFSCCTGATVWVALGESLGYGNLVGFATWEVSLFLFWFCWVTSIKPSREKALLDLFYFFFLLSHIASLYVYVTDKTKWNDFLCVWRILLQKKSPSLNQVILRFIWYYCISLYSGGFIDHFLLILVGRIMKLFSDKIT